MADFAESSSTSNSKPVIVRVKRKAIQSPLLGFWLEINERPLKKQLLNFEKLSLSDAPAKVQEVKTKKVFVQHVETVNSSDVTVDTLLPFVPSSARTSESTTKSEEWRRSFKAEKKHDQLLVKAKQEQEILSRKARFEQIWRSRKGKKEAMHDEAIHEMCSFYDIVRVDVEETTNEVQDPQDTYLEDHRLMYSYLPLLKEFIPSAAEEIEFDINNYISTQAARGNYVYDLYAVKDDVSIPEEDASSPFPLVQVDDVDDFYDGPSDSEFESDDSNAENNPLNDYPDEVASEDEDEEKNSSDDSEGNESASESDESSDKAADHYNCGENGLFEEEFYVDDDYDDHSDEEEWR